MTTASNSRVLRTIPFLMVACFLSFPARAQFAGGSGTADDPYQIATAAALRSIGSDPNLLDKHFVLVNDIDLDPNLPGGRIFDRAVIAPDTAKTSDYEGTPFTGLLDGNGRVIRNVVISAEASNWIGLFGYVGPGAQVKNLGVTGVSIQGHKYVGALAGYCEDSHVLSSYCEGHVQAHERAGGLVGFLWAGEVRCCYAFGNIEGGKFIGGLVGTNNGTIVTSYAACAVRGDRWIGGLVGIDYSEGSSFLSYWDTDVSGQTYSAGGRGKCKEDMKKADTYRGWGHARVWTIDDGNDYPRLAWQRQPGILLLDSPRSYGGGTGDPNDPYQIWNAQQLATIAWYEDDFSKYFVLMTDIDLNDISPGLLIPIGTIGVPFTGVFDGGNHVIDNFHYISDQENFIGMFGSIANTGSEPNAFAGKLLNLGLTNVQISGHGNVGGLVAANKGAIEQCLVTGSVAGLSNVGGLAGRNKDGGVIVSCQSDTIVTGGPSTGGVVGYNTGRITCCHSTANVIGETYTGGLVGFNIGEVTRSSSAGEVSGENRTGGLIGFNGETTLACFSTSAVAGGESVGGLVGSNTGLVLSCYSTGSAIGDDSVGGLVGLSFGTIACSYSTGTVQGGAYAGGLAGGPRSSAYLSYWDIQTSGMTTSAAGEGRTTEHLMDAGAYRGWGCDSAWVIDDGRDYPRLAWEGTPGQPIMDEPRSYGGGTGTDQDPYQIWTAEQFASIHWYWSDFDRHFVLMADLDIGLVDPNLLGPIGASRLPFTGTFDGRGHVISNWTHRAQENYIGVFGYIKQSDPNLGLASGLVKDLHLTSLTATGLYNVGGIAGGNNGTIVSCTVSVDISGDRYVGGIVGDNQGHIESCESAGQITGRMQVGGVVGYNKGNILSCYTEAQVEGNSYIGGLVGDNSGWLLGSSMIRSCHAKANVWGNDYVGGLLGYTSKGTVLSCSSSGHVVGIDSAGGLIGRIYYSGAVTMCHSTTAVTSDGFGVGGLIGWNEGGVIAQCFATGQIEGRSAVGGLVGHNYEKGSHVGWPERTRIAFCYAQGDVSGTDRVGGLVGYDRRGTLYSCYSTGRVTGDESVGGLVGEHGRGPVHLCYWDTETSGVSSSAAGRGSTTEKLMMADTFVGWGDGVWRIDQGHDYPRLAWEQTPGELIGETGPRYGGDTGTLDDPYQIWTADQLVGLAYYPEDHAKHFALMADVDLSTIDPNEIIPIGMDLAPFTGTFEGNGHIVSNFVYESEDEDYVGLFGYVGPLFSESTENEGVIRNLHLVNTKIHGKDQVGGIAGESSGTINACSVTGNIQGKEMIGGLVGKNWGIIKQCWTTASVTGKQHTGALVGYHGKIDEYRPGLIYSCYTIGNVWGDNHTGGLVGSTYGWIESCYSHAQVTGVSAVGGLVGLNRPRGTIVRCYSTGPVTGSPNIGGLVGTGQTRCTFISFWDVETSGVLSGAGGSGKITAQMFDAETFEGWGLSGDWTIDEGSDYPHLAWENAPGTLIVSQPYTYGGGSGQLEDPYQIWTPEQFVSIADHYEDFNKCFILMADIDVNSVSLGRIRTIGTYTIPFTGIFEGNYHTIHNLRYETKDEDWVGVFGCLGSLQSDGSLSGGTVKNLHLANVAVAGGNYVGGLAGGCYGGTLVSCGVSGRVTGATDVGGLVGLGWRADISSSSTSGTVNGYMEVGGLVGRQQSGQVVQSKSTCQVSGHEKLGGLIGSHLPYPEESLLSQCTATGSVRGHRVLGGLVGDNGGTITNCYAAVDVIGESYTSGVGTRGEPRTTYSYRVAGLVGANNGQIMFSYCSSNVEGHQEVGGLIGAQEKGESVSCFWDVEASGTTDGVGNLDPDPEGVVGKTTAEMQSASTFLGAGWDFVYETANGTYDIWWILEGQDYPRLWWESIPEN